MQCLRQTVLKSLVSISNRTSIIQQTIRPSSYQSSILVDDESKFKVSYETTRFPEDWKYVERILPPATVPAPIEKESYPCGWQPPKVDVQDKVYHVARTKNFMMPVYLEITHRGIKKMTRVRKIQGNIWRLESEIRSLLGKDTIKPVRTQVNEFGGNILIHGDHVEVVKKMLLQKGF